MAMDFAKEAPNVVTEAGFRDLIASGYHVEILCMGDAYRKNSVWCGHWVLSAVNDQGCQRHLVTARARTSGDSIKIRTFKTITGLVSLLVDMGFAFVSFPVYEGQRCTVTLSECDDDTNNG